MQNYCYSVVAGLRVKVTPFFKGEKECYCTVTVGEMVGLGNCCERMDKLKVNFLVFFPCNSTTLLKSLFFF